MKARIEHRRAERGQTIVLGVLTLFILALVVMISFNVTVATHQKIKIQNHADTTAYSMAVQQARALNYFVYTNRAIASSYVGMANLHAYMSEAAMLADIKMGAAQAFQQIALLEFAQSFCGKIPCCKFTHCWHQFEANFNAAFLTIEWITGKQGKRIKKLDKPAVNVLKALNVHIGALRLSQNAMRLQMLSLVGTGDVGSLLDENMQGAKDVAENDATRVAAQNLFMWNRLFYSDQDKKRRIMAEVANSTRHPFAWNRHGSPAVQVILFPLPFLQTQIKSSPWMGPKGNWFITQVPDTGFMAGGRTGFTKGNFPMTAGGIVIVSQDAPASTAHGKTLASFDYGQLLGTWRHGAGTAMLPLMGPIGPGELFTGDGNKHKAGFLDFFNRPHEGNNHKDPALEMDRFMEFKIATDPPYNQPSVYAAASTDARVTENGIRGPWEIAKDGTGTIQMDMKEGGQGSITLTNNERSKAVSKALVYYHRIGDWSDYPNLFNPYWRAKLHPMSLTEVGTVVTPVDPNSAVVTGAMGAIGGNVAAGANVGR